jgi:flagellar basal body-associated protein FliL
LRRLDRAWAEAEPTEDGRPVFVDRSGRRRRVAIVVGSSLAVVIVVAIVMLVAGLSGVAPLGVPGFPDLAKQTKAPATETTPGPADPRSAVLPVTGPSTPTTTETASPSPSRSSPRHDPTQTPPHPSKTK